MTAVQVKVGTSVAVLLWALLKGRRAAAATGDVSLGTPTVIAPGSELLDNQGYWSASDGAVSTSPELRALTNQSADAIAAFDAANPGNVAGDYGRL